MMKQLKILQRLPIRRYWTGSLSMLSDIQIQMDLICDTTCPFTVLLLRFKNIRTYVGTCIVLAKQ